MNLKALKYFCQVAQMGSFTKAADALHVAQPSLSMAITRLEEELGVSLFNRAGRAVSVTPEGQAFLHHAEASLLNLSLGRQVLSDYAHLDKGQIKVGFPPMYGLGHFTRLLTRFRLQRPGIEMFAVEGGAHDIGQRLIAREIDIALMETGRIDTRCDSVSFGTDEMVLCVRQDHPLALEKYIRADQLDGLDVVAFDESYVQRQMLDNFCRDNNVKAKIVMQTNFVSLVMDAALSGIGAVTLLRSMQEREATLVGIPFATRQTMSFSLAWRANEHLSFANKAFLDFATHPSACV